MLEFNNTIDYLADFSSFAKKKLFVFHIKTNKIIQIKPYNIDK